LLALPLPYIVLLTDRVIITLYILITLNILPLLPFALAVIGLPALHIRHPVRWPLYIPLPVISTSSRRLLPYLA
jgi:hypothetical protein